MSSTEPRAERFPMPARNGVVTVKAEINGVRGLFILDTGATYVAVKSAFASRARIPQADASEITVNTANGPTRAKLSEASKVRLGKLEAVKTTRCGAGRRKNLWSRRRRPARNEFSLAVRGPDGEWHGRGSHPPAEKVRTCHPRGASTAVRSPRCSLVSNPIRPEAAFRTTPSGSIQESAPEAVSEIILSYYQIYPTMYGEDRRRHAGTSGGGC